MLHDMHHIAAGILSEDFWKGDPSWRENCRLGTPGYVVNNGDHWNGMGILTKTEHFCQLDYILSLLSIQVIIRSYPSSA